VASKRYDERTGEQMTPNDGLLLNTILQTLTTQNQYWYPQLLLYSTRLLGVLVFVQFSYIAVDLVASHDATRLLDNMVAAVIRVGLVYVLLNNAVDWGQAIINTGIQIGQTVTGQSPSVLTPSGVFQAGLNMVGTLWHAKAAGGWLHPFQEIEFMFVTIGIVLAWAATSFIYLGALLEGVWIVYTGPILICFSALSSTAPMLIKWATRVLAIAVKIAVLLLVLAVGMGLARTWGQQLADNASSISTDFWLSIQSLVESILFCYLVYKVPGAVTSLVGSTTFDFGESFLSSAGGTSGESAQEAGTAVAKAAGHAVANVATASANAAANLSKTVRAMILS
jgi:P-type conjugative transfer protein TrbL